MAASPFRDRLTRRGAARALLSPIGLVAGAAVGVLVAVVGAPVWAAVLAGAAVWALNAVRVLPRSRRRAERIDPFTVQEPWRRFVQEALQARTRIAEAVDRAPSGPLHDRLHEIAARVDTGVDETWLIARRGQALVRARRQLDLARIDRQLAELRPGAASAGERDHPAEVDPTVASVVESLEAQRAAATRLDAVIDRTQSDLRVLDARLDEAVARTLELSARAGSDAAVAGLSSDVDDLVTEMEALRLALDETDAAAGNPPPPPRDLPRGGTA
jgi:hypothetical protein